MREGEGQARGSSGSVSALGLGGAVSLCEIGGLGDRSGSLGCYRGELWGPSGSLGWGRVEGPFCHPGVPGLLFEFGGRLGDPSGLGMV